MVNARILHPVLSLLFVIQLPVLETAQLPVIIWHGMGDHGRGAGIQELAKVIENSIPGIRVKCITTGQSDIQVSSRSKVVCIYFTVFVIADDLPQWLEAISRKQRPFGLNDNTQYHEIKLCS
ncbi:hypothetical protein P879_09002 [Paragonimus westermani]|uniref:Palmitoyl-protein thioesterase 1 n=1 Tax=Paragonimus westermani TaxID=34504 RepID=A0A8T0D822_9TREM|nr:hypothetical protein P879_09002 [Paragonimus westermani]